MRPGKKRRAAEAAPKRTSSSAPRRNPASRLETRPNADAVAGRNSVVEALRAKIPAKELVIAERAEIDERMAEAIRLAKNADLPIKEVPRGQLDGLTGTTTHQGIALVIKPFHYSPFDELLAKAKKPGLLIGLDGVTDPHNLGAIVRSAAAFGADGVVISTEEAVFLCRCGHSENKPFCDGAHRAAGFEDSGCHAPTGS